MCTSFTYSTNDNLKFLSRTMDFSFLLEALPSVMPRNYEYSFEKGDSITTKYGFVGGARKTSKYIFADGVNEKGLGFCELYFPDEAYYDKETQGGKINLASYEFIVWVLGQFATIKEVKEHLNEIHFVEESLDLLGAVVPLHYIMSDQTGACLVIEPRKDGVHVVDNPVGVMANSPEIEWHLKNMNNLLGFQPDNFNNKTYGDLEIHPFGQASGTYGLPGGYTSPERFLRTAYSKKYTLAATGEEQALFNIFDILNPVTIPKGINTHKNGLPDYTQYRGVLNLSKPAYYFNNYGSSTIYKLELTEEMLNSNEPQSYNVDSTFKTQSL